VGQHAVRILHVSAGENGEPPNFRAVAIDKSEIEYLDNRDMVFIGASVEFNELVKKVKDKKVSRVEGMARQIVRPGSPIYTTWSPN
jgi:hypothetical protein